MPNFIWLKIIVLRFARLNYRMIDAGRYVLVGFLSLISFVAFAQLNAEFTADTTFGCGSLGVQFTDQSTGNITSRNWDFGNSNTSTLTNPFENFGVGVYTISLTVSDGTNSDTESKLAYINVYAEPTADFTFTPATGCTPLPVSFTNTSTPAGGPIQSYIWDLDDGNQGPNQPNFTHVYQGGGPYQPTLQIIDANGCSDSKASTTNVTPTVAPAAVFGTQASPIGCAVPFTVNFTNSSTGGNLTYQWDFGDGNTSTQVSPSHTYTALGNYTVRLIVSDPNCSDTLSIPNLVRVNSTLADFTFPNDTVCFGEAVEFDNLSLGATTFSWDFDDGSPLSFNRDPIHVFRDSGWFDVRLVASLGSSCTDQIIKQIYVQRVIADFAISDTVGCDLPDTIQFINNSSNAFSYEWRVSGINEVPTDTVYVYDTLSPFHIISSEGTFSDTLIASTEFGCTDVVIKNLRVRDTIDVAIDLLDQNGINLGNDYGDCIPFTLQFTDTINGPGTMFTYLWDFGTDTIFGRSVPPRIYDTVGNFKVILKVQNELGCSSLAEAEIAARDKRDPAFVVFPDSVCYGDSITIQMTNDSNSIYEFSILTPNDGNRYEEDQINTGYFNVFNDTGYYAVSVKVGEVCDTNLVIDSAFYVKGPVSRPIYSGNCLFPDSIYFKARAAGYTRFYWDFGDGSPRDSVNIDPTHFYARDTVFRFSLTLFNDSNDCGPKTDTFEIDLTPIRKPSVLPYKKNICRGQAIRLYLNNSVFYDSTEWYINGNYLGNFEDSTFANGSFPLGFSDIWMVGTNDFGCKDTVFDKLAISNLQPRINFSNNAGCLPLEVQLNDASINNLQNVDWQWFFSDLPNDTLLGDTVNRTIVQQGPINVRLVVTDTINCRADTTIDSLIIASNPLVDFITNQNLNICQGDTVQFFNRSSGNQINNIWDWRDGTLDTNNNALVTHQFDSAGAFNIRLVVIDATGCRDTLARYVVNVEQSPQANFMADTTQASCYPLAVNFTDISIGNINQWIWNLGNQDRIVVQNPFRNFIRPGSFDIGLIVFTPNGCSDTIVKQDYIQISGPTAEFTIDPDTVCLNEPVNFSITSSNGVGSFRWAFGDGNSSTNDPATHIYTDTVGLVQPTLIIRDALGNCEVFLRDSLTILRVIADFELDDTIGCAPFRPKVINRMEGADNFFWDLGDGRQSNDVTPDLVYEQAGQYTLTLNVSNNNGCDDQMSMDITVLPSPTAVINGNDFLCAGDSLSLSGSGGTILGWYIGDSLLSMSSNITIDPDSSTSISLIVENNQSCRDTAVLDLFVQQPPNYTPLNDTTIIIGEELMINLNAGNGFFYSWSPDDWLSCLDCPKPIIKPLRSTTYLINISDSLGCFSISDTFSVEVIEEFSLEVPQAFSPNGDGNNDVIYAKGWGLKELIAFKIYNRFGELVFEGNDFDEGWDGTYKGKDQMIETYIYTVEAVTYSGEILSRKGNITLIR